MSSFDNYEDIESHFLSAPTKSPRHGANVSSRKSSASLRVSSNGPETDGGNGQHSLAHELAVALMPEPSSGSRMLAEEFGIEYDEGAEGIDEEAQELDVALGSSGGSLANEFQEATSPNGNLEFFDASPPSPSPYHRETTDEAPMASLARSLESTDQFLAHLRSLDSDTHSTSHPALENIASDIIRRINDTVRDREEQVRELLEVEREFRKISTGLGGMDVLGDLEELPDAESDEDDEPEPANRLERTPIETSHRSASGWDIDPHTPVADNDHPDPFSKPPPINGPLTPAKAIPHLTFFRSCTSSLVSSLGTISEQTQVTGAATTEAGRKIRALKNKIGTWRIELDNAELSRLKVERWEAGIPEGDGDVPQSPVIPRRIDGRKVVAEHLRLFEISVAEATRKTQLIMAM
ncbi:hypothetical protein EYR38_008946 [Pleurotus pulmonarius]|nr:hypothetical protein EYR38_008946 [Pleurotus pulmonarius]